MNLYLFTVLNFISILIIASWLYHKFFNLYEKQEYFMYGRERDLLDWSFGILSNIGVIEGEIEDKDQFIQKYKEIDQLLSSIQKNYDIVELDRNLKQLQKKLNSFKTEEVDHKINLLKKYEVKYDEVQSFIFIVEKNLPLLERFNSLDMEKLKTNINFLSDISHKINDLDKLEYNNISKIVERIEPKSEKLNKFLENCQNKKDEYKIIIQDVRNLKGEYSKNIQDIRKLKGNLDFFIKKYNTFIDIKNSSKPFFRYWKLVNNMYLFVLITVLSVFILFFAYTPQYNENQLKRFIYENTDFDQQNKIIKDDILKELNVLIDNRMNEIKEVHIETSRLSNLIDQKREIFLKKIGKKDN